MRRAATRCETNPASRGPEKTDDGLDEERGGREHPRGGPRVASSARPAADAEGLLEEHDDRLRDEEGERPRHHREAGEETETDPDRVRVKAGTHDERQKYADERAPLA